MLSTSAVHALQTPTDPLAPTAPAGADGFERYTVHAGSPGLVLAVTWARFAGREITEGAFTLVHEGRQHTVSMSARLGADDALPGTLQITIGDAVELLITLADEAGQLGITAELRVDFDETLVVPAPPVRPADVPFTVPQRVALGRWSGRVVLDGKVLPVDPDPESVVVDGLIAVGEGSRGILPPAAHLRAPAHTLPQLFWLRVAVPTAAGLVHVMVAEDEAGRRWFSDARVPGHAGADQVVDVQVHWQPGTRWPERVRVALLPTDGVSPGSTTVEVHATRGVPVAGRALGLVDPSWPEALWHDELAVGRSCWDPAALAPDDVHHLHRFVWADVRGSGVGEVAAIIGPALDEVLAVGPHATSGLQGFTDGAGS